MTKPEYLDQIDKVANEFTNKSYEVKLLNAWSSFEVAAKKLPKEYDILDPNIPEAFFEQMTDFIALLYENQDGDPQSDCEQIREKDKAYGGSWHSRGGTGAFHALARKGDRITSMLALHKSLANCKAYVKGEAIDDTIGDLRRYLILVTAWHWASPQVEKVPEPRADDAPDLHGLVEYMPEPEQPKEILCAQCNHTLSHHDGDGCNDIDQNSGGCTRKS